VADVYRSVSGRRVEIDIEVKESVWNSHCRKGVEMGGSYGEVNSPRQKAAQQ
jgi:hypothetical protein